MITAGIEWILSLLTPASAFIKAAKAIYEIVKFFIERAGQIADLINAILDAIGALAQLNEVIASGSLDQAVKGVENALAKSLPVVISFLASLLGLGGIAGKIQAIFQKLRKPMEKAVDWVIDKGAKAFKKLGNKLKNSKLGKKAGKLKDSAKEKYQAGKQWVEDKKKAKKDKKDESITPAEQKKHEAIAYKIYQELKPDEQQSEGTNEYLKSKRKQAKKLKQIYSRQIRKGIKLTIDLTKWQNTDKQTAKVKLHISIKPNDTEKDYEIFHKEGDLGNKLDELIERALEKVTGEFYQGKSNKDKSALPKGIQRTLASIQADYGNATRDANNLLTVGGNKFFVDQGRNNYVYPYQDAEKAKIINKSNKITTEKDVKGYEYSRFGNITVGRLSNLLRNIHDNQNTKPQETAMLLASLAAEPYRYGPAHITNLIALANPANANQSAFSIMAMTTGGTDPTSAKNIAKDPQGKGTVPEKVRARQIEIVKNDSDLYSRLESNYRKNSSKNDNEILRIFQHIIRIHLNQKIK